MIQGVERARYLWYRRRGSDLFLIDRFCEVMELNQLQGIPEPLPLGGRVPV